MLGRDKSERRTELPTRTKDRAGATRSHQIHPISSNSDEANERASRGIRRLLRLPKLHASLPVPFHDRSSANCVISNHRATFHNDEIDRGVCIAMRAGGNRVAARQERLLNSRLFRKSGPRERRGQIRQLSCGNFFAMRYLAAEIGMLGQMLAIRGWPSRCHEQIMDTEWSQKRPY